MINKKTILPAAVMLATVAVVAFLTVVISFGLQHSVADGTLIWQQVLAGVAGYFVLALTIWAAVLGFRLLKPSSEAIKHVRQLRNVFIEMSAVLLGILPLVYRAADFGDAPGAMVIGLGVVLLPAAIAVLINLVTNAITGK